MVYRHFAEVYDQLMEHAPYDKWAAFTEKIIKRSNKTVGEIVDLGCGTGEVALRLQALNYSMIGVDLSTEMLSVAAKKSQEQGKNMTWLKQDIRNLAGFKDVELFISYCDVLNYITTKADLLAVFEAVFSSLASDGLFIFDVHSSDYANEQLVGQTFTQVDGDISYIWNCFPGETTGEMVHEMTFFSKVNDLYERFDEIHYQQVYEIEVYKDLLKKVGFTKVEFFADFNVENSNLTKNVERYFIVAEKNT